MEYLVHIMILLCIYIALSQSLNLVAGHTGMLSIAHASFYGLGAYVAALMALRLGSPFLLNIACAAVLSGLLGALVGALCVRVRGDYFAIATLAFQITVFSVLYNWVSFTGGPMGLAGVPRPSILGWEVSSHLGFLILAAFFCGLIVWGCRRIVNSAFGRVLKAIREDEALAQAAGKNVSAYKAVVFAVGAGMASVAGVLYAYHISFIDPTSFTVMESIFLISIVVIGGAGSLWGPVVGAVVLVMLPELLRFIGLPGSVAANLRQILYGATLVAFMMWRPHGLLGDYAFEKDGAQG